LRFDDTLETVLASDVSTPLGMQSAWRQLVDLVGRGRVAADARTIATLEWMMESVPLPVRAASARGLDYAAPPAALVRLLASDEPAVSVPILRCARLAAEEWVALLPELTPTGRAVLRLRSDLDGAVQRALESFGPTDFVLADASGERPAMEAPWIAAEAAVREEIALVAPVEAVPEAVGAGSSFTYWTAAEGVQAMRLPEEPGDDLEVLAQSDEDALLARTIAEWRQIGGGAPVRDDTHEVAATVSEPAEAAPEAEEDDSYLSLVASPAVTPRVSTPVEDYFDSDPDPIEEEEVLELPEAPRFLKPLEPIAPAVEAPLAPMVETGDAIDGPFEIADVVARIDAFYRNRDEIAARVPSAAHRADGFRFETDPRGVVRWVSGVSRAPVIGLSLAEQQSPENAQIDAIAAGAFRQRAPFSSARLQIDGESDAAGAWLISAVPVFDPENGRFTGYRGTARRPRMDERAEPRPRPAVDSLRQLVHELRTPTNAIAGFAEMIECEMLGPVPGTYRGHATAIRREARELLGAIDDLDLAARIDSKALALMADRVALRPVLAGIAEDLAPLLGLRGARLSLPEADVEVAGDRRAVERLLARLLATLSSASSDGEVLGIRLAGEGDAMIAIRIDRPQALADYPGEQVFGLDDEGGDATLLGTGFALRLARNLARELGGSLTITSESLTLRLRASDNHGVERAQTL
jgi:signal transduction histidine kinase